MIELSDNIEIPRYGQVEAPPKVRLAVAAYFVAYRSRYGARLQSWRYDGRTGFIHIKKAVLAAEDTGVCLSRLRQLTRMLKS